jgi:predicted MFS family arabinose efflux permease
MVRRADPEHVEDGPVPAPAGRGRALVAFTSRDFRLLWGGQTVSMIGDAAFVVAIGWLTYSASGSGALGIVLMLQALGLILTLLVGGALADRLSRRRMMVVSDLARAAVVSTLVVLETTGHASIAAIGTVAFVNGLCSGFFMPAFGGIVPLVVEQPHLSSANALIGVSRQLSLVVGPAVAGLLYDPLGPAAVFGLDAASYVFAAALVWRSQPRPYARQERSGALREVAEGFRYVASVPWLWVTILLFSLFLMGVIAPVQVLLPELVSEHFGRGVGAYGTVFAAQGVGMVLGALGFAQLAPSRHRGVLSYVLWSANALAIVLFVVSPWFGVALALAVARGAALGFGIAVWETILMSLVPEGLLSRVISVDYFGSVGLMPIGLAAAGVASDAASAEVLLVTGAAISAVVFAACLPARWLRAVQ